MKETTVYESEDGRRFESADECLQWEQTLAQIRKIRQKLWEHQAHLYRTEQQYGEEYIRQQIGTECTDESVIDLFLSSDVELDLCGKFGNLREVNPEDALRQLNYIKRTYEFAFGD